MPNYIFKDVDHYKQIKRLYNFYPLTVIWHDEGAPSPKIGKCVECFTKWFAQTDDYSYQSFGNYYFENIRSVADLQELSKHLYNLFEKHKDTFVKKQDKILNLDNIFDLIILHAIIETYNGQFCEERVKQILEQRGTPYNKVEYLDRTYGIDLLVTNKNNDSTSGIQIKPISFFLGNKPDLVRDREKVFIQLKNLHNGKNEYNVKRLFFVIYKVVDNEIRFLSKEDNIFHEFSDMGDMMKNDWATVCNTTDYWKN